MGKGFFNKMVPLTTDTLLVLGLNGLSTIMGEQVMNVGTVLLNYIHLVG